MNKQKLQQIQQLKLTPQQIQFLGLLQIPIIALEKRIEEELEENPVLEEEEEEPINIEEESNINYQKKPNDSEEYNLSKFQANEQKKSITAYLSQQLIEVMCGR